MEELMGKDVVVQRKSPGEGETAEYGTVVKCHLTGYFYSTVTKERTNDEPFEVLKDQSFQIGEADTVPGLELALRHARKGEKLSVFIASRFAFGIAGRNYQAVNQGNAEKKNGEGENEQNNEKLDLKSPAIKESNVVVVPPDQDIEYEIEVLTHRTDREFDSDFLRRFESASNETLTEEEKEELRNRLLTLQSLQLRKESGNRWFSYGEYGRAAKAYSKATQISEGYFNKPATGEGEGGEGDNTKSLEEKVLESEAKKDEKIPAEENEVVAVYVSCLNNLAACKLATKEYYQAKELCTKVLEFSPFNAKALLRAAKASLATDSFEECELCLKRLLDLEKLDKNIKAAANAELAKLRKAQANYKAQAKEMQKRIAGKLFGNTTSKPSATNTPTPTSSKQENKDVTESKEPKEKEESHSSIDSYNEGTTTTTKATSKTSSNLVLLLATSFIVVALSIFLALTYKAKK